MRYNVPSGLLYTARYAMVLYGHAVRIGDDITTDQIIAPEHREAGDPAVLAAECLAALDPALAERVREGDVLLAGIGLGAGAGQEEAALALLAAGFAAVLCISANPGFAAAAGALGLPVLECSQATTPADGALLRIDIASGRIEDRDTGTPLQAQPAPPAVIAAARQAQLLARTRQAIEEE